MLVLVDSEATQNFIDAWIMEWRGIHTETFEGFSVLVPRNQRMQCVKYVPNLTLTMGKYSTINHFFVVDVPDTKVVMSV